MVNPIAPQPTALPVTQPQATTPPAPKSKTPLLEVDRISLSTRAAFGMTTVGIVGQPRGALRQNPKISDELQALRYSAPFQTVYRNFDLLPAHTQEETLEKLAFILKKHPDFLEKLAKVQNPQHGEGFQFFFIPDKSHPRWESVPPPVRGMGEVTDYIGIVYSSPVNAVVTHPVIGRGLHGFTQGVVAGMGKVLPARAGLDVGGMYADVSADTFAHEMGHVLHGYFMSNTDRLEIWSIYSEAKASGQGFITDYAKTNHMEFFAEGIEAYMNKNWKGEYTERERLAKVNPDFYRFVARMLEPETPFQGQDPYVSSWKLAKSKAQRTPEALKGLKEKGSQLVSKIKNWF